MSKRDSEVRGELSVEALRAFLEAPRIARLATTDEGGYPYIVPVWYEFDAGTFWVVAQEHVAWLRYLRRDPRVALSIADDTFPYPRVFAQGRATFVEGPALEGRWREVLLRNAARHIGAEAGGRYLERTRGIRRYLLRIEPERLVSRGSV